MPPVYADWTDALRYRNLCRQHGVSEGNTGVGESAKVNHHKGGPVGPGLLHPVDEYPLGVALQGVEFMTGCGIAAAGGH